MNIGIIGSGIYLPEQIRTNDYWASERVAAWRAKLERVAPERSTDGNRTANALRSSDPFQGARERRVAAEGELSSDLEVAAARVALENAGLVASDVDVLFCHSLVPDYLCCNVSSIVHGKLGLRRDIMPVTVDAMCLSFLVQMQMAGRSIRAGEGRVGLITQSSVASRIISEDVWFSTWLGDGASALVVGLVDTGYGLLSSAFRTEGRLHGAFVASVPDGRWWDEGRIVACNADRVAARKSLEITMDVAKEVVDEALQRAGVTTSDIGFFACHQANGYFRPLCQEACGLGSARVMDTFPWTGSLSSANIPTQLHLAAKEGILRKGDLVLAFTVASGMNFGAAVIRWSI